jgi:dipeptidyl aminopeptidase/acylaminoacyl peptidase
MNPDIRDTPLFREARLAIERQLMPGSQRLMDATDLNAHPDGGVAAFTGVTADSAGGPLESRIWTLDLHNGQLELRTHGRGNQRLPRFAPDGQTIAFLSDREHVGVYQAQLMGANTSAVKSGPKVPGSAESLEWDREGQRLLVIAAGLDADQAGAQGGIKAGDVRESTADWLPEVDGGSSEDQGRRAYVAAVHAESATAVSPSGLNVWEAAWCGASSLVAIASDSPDESSWYQANVRQINLAGSSTRTLYTPRWQVGWVCASPNGSLCAVVEALCSDRLIVAGEIVLVSIDGAPPRRLQTNGVDVSALQFVDDNTLMFAGNRSTETVLGTIELATGAVRMLWSSSELTFGETFLPKFAPVGTDRALALVEGFASRPALTLLSGTTQRQVCALCNPELDDEVAELLESAHTTRWSAPDGLEIHGFVLQPRHFDGPAPLTLEIHGGPLGQWRPRWLGRNALRRMLLRRGHAILLANPRGSIGRGHGFAARVFGDMGGADAQDLLSGVDHMVSEAIADPARLFVFGTSYGGYMSSWLVTQDSRFAAAVPTSPVTNWISEHLTSHIPLFCKLFLDDDLRQPGGRYHSRSPVYFADRVTTPVLNVAGALDRNTPPGQALEFHHALLEHGKRSVLVIYPKEGHGVRGYPALVDYSARVVGWFEQHASN